MAQKETIIINLFGGPGTGKSTTQAELFAYIKRNHTNIDVEMVREYAKELAWQKINLSRLQEELFKEQSRREEILLGKVDYIITDSPLWLCHVYDNFYNGGSSFLSRIKKVYKTREEAGHRQVNVFLERKPVYVPRGRGETEEQAKAIDTVIKSLLPLDFVYAKNYKDISDRLGLVRESP